MHLGTKTRRVTDAHSFGVLVCCQVAKDVLARTDGNLQIGRVAKVLIRVEKCVPYQRGPHDGRHAFGKVRATRLIIEVIAPTGAAVAGRSIVQEPLKSKARS